VNGENASVPQNLPADNNVGSSTSSWAAKYATKHRWIRLTDFPAGIRAPSRVRIYRRSSHFLVQWWEPSVKQNRAERVAGDLLTALNRAREIDERLAHHRTAGVGRNRLSHAQLIDLYVADLEKRADAGTISPSSHQRLRGALQHYCRFCQELSVRKEFTFANSINRSFRLAFATYLVERQVSPNGHANTPSRPMKGQAFVMNAVRTMLEWAADPARGALLPVTFQNPFRRWNEGRLQPLSDPLAPPDITLNMAIAFVAECDRFQLRLFVPLILFGLRPSELCFLIHEHLDSDWLQAACIPDLSYYSKGKRSKRLPLIEELNSFWGTLRQNKKHGLLYERRAVFEEEEQVALRGAAVTELVTEFRKRCAASGLLSAAERLRLRGTVLYDAGGLNYDHVDQEFRTLARRVEWPAEATLKDFRHLFATMVGNTPMAEAYKKYLLGQSVGRESIMAYTHLNQLRRQYTEAVRREWTPLIEAILMRVRELQ
jgi:hypothetical protein